MVSDVNQTEECGLLRYNRVSIISPFRSCKWCREEEEEEGGGGNERLCSWRQLYHHHRRARQNHHCRARHHD
ncbi:unnamed protein product, partial [Brassica oleracea var. botrytis]